MGPGCCCYLKIIHVTMEAGNPNTETVSTSVKTNIDKPL